MKPGKQSAIKSLVVIAVLLAVGLLARGGVNAAPPPAQLSYQGLVKVAGVPFTGTGTFKFAIVDAATGDGTALWATGDETLTVTNGLFNFLLGSTTPLPSSVFANDPIYLRVWFNGTALEPNQRIVSAAYALRAEDAAKLGGSPASDYLKTTSALDASNLASGTVPLARLPGIPWSQLTSVPPGFADGVDDGATYSAGANLTLSGTTFSLANSVTLSGDLAAGGAVSAGGTVSVGDYVKIGASSASCDVSKAGAVRWNGTTSSLEVCNGSSWQVVGASGGTTYTLTVGKAGTGSGTVASSPSGIYCGVACSASFNSGASVTLTATPDANSSFAGWTGSCSGTGACAVTMSAARAVTATFTRNTYTLSVSSAGSGSGTVTSNPTGINCGATCSVSFNADTLVTLIATPSATSRFTGWSGACSGADACVLTMSAAKSVVATFGQQTAFKAQFPSAQSFTSLGSFVPLAFSTVAFNDASAYSTATGRFTAPVSGTYQFHCYIRLVINDTGGYQIAAAIYQNGTGLNPRVQSTFSQALPADYSLQVSEVVKANAGDYFECRAYKGSGSSSSVLGDFSGYLIY